MSTEVALCVFCAQPFPIVDVAIFQEVNLEDGETHKVFRHCLCEHSRLWEYIDWNSAEVKKLLLCLKEKEAVVQECHAKKQAHKQEIYQLESRISQIERAILRQKIQEMNTQILKEEYLHEYIKNKQNK